MIYIYDSKQDSMEQINYIKLANELKFKLGNFYNFFGFYEKFKYKNRSY